MTSQKNKNQVNTVATLLIHHKEKLFELAATNRRSECTNYVKELLEADEAKNISQADKDRCIETLRSCEKSESRYFSTLATWVIAIKC